MEHVNMTRKEYAASIGIGTNGRGRPSKEQIAAADEAERKGMRFKDSKVVVKTKTEGGEVAETVEKVENVNYYGPTPEAIYPNNFYVFIDGKKKPVSNRSACMNCRVSLSHHACNTPQVVYGSEPMAVAYG